MKHVTTQFVPVEYTSFDPISIMGYFQTIGVSDPTEQIPKNITGLDYLPAFAGKLCYNSFEPGLNPNVSKVRTDYKDYIGNILKQKHGAVLEHSSISFVFHNVSRVFTHELVRHRAGVAISQESLRYVRLQTIPMNIPDSLSKYDDKIVSIIEQVEDLYGDIVSDFDLDNPDVSFHVKKEITSAMRRLAPEGLATTILWTANLRTLRHVVALRTALGAEEEIRKVFLSVARYAKRFAPYAFQDMTIDDNGVCSFEYDKV